MINEQPKEKNNSKIKIAIIVVMVLVLIGGVTYAIISGFSITNGDYSYHTTCFDISYDITNDDGTSDITGILMPSADYTDGLSGSVSIGLDPDCNVPGEGNLYLNINNNESAATFIQTVEPHCENSKTLETMTDYSDESSCTAASNGVWVTDGTALKYTVYEEGNVQPVSVGYINKAGQKINIHKKFNVVGSHKFDIYIWLDGHLVDNTYTNLELRGAISADVSQVGSIGNAAAPILDDGMIPVTIADDGTVTTVLSNSNNWYDYSNKEWANVVLIKNDLYYNELYDLSGNSNSSTINSATWSDSGLTFDGTDDYVLLPSVSLASLEAFSVEVEFSIDELPSEDEYLIANLNDGGFGINISNAGILTFTVYDKTTATYVSAATTSAIELGKKYLVTGVFDGTRIILYVNGLFVSSNTIDTVGDPKVIPAITLGCNPQVNTSGTNCESGLFKGSLYSTRFYDKGLTTTEVANNYYENATKDGLFFYYDFEDGRRLLYKDNAGVVVPSEEILAYYVWVPRYKYKIWDVTGTSSPQTIDIVFERPYSEMLLGNEVGEYRTHPAFWWDDNSDGKVDSNEMLAGIWVGKFETTGDATTPTILPNVSSLRSQTVSANFATSLKFAGGVQSGSEVSFVGNTTYGLTSKTDSHIIKNSEWGAVAYLSHSQYGINYEIRNNNNSNFITGCGASSESGAAVSSCEIAYGGATSYPQSTTGNITGVFDMSGGAWDYVMGNYNKTISSGGFSVLPESKYYDLYTSTDVSTACNGGICYGHALSETVGWYNDRADFLTASNSWLLRGDTQVNNTTTGSFTYAVSAGGAYESWGFRSLLVPVYSATDSDSVANISSTNNVASSQTVTLYWGNVDDANLYYWGTSEPTATSDGWLNAGTVSGVAKTVNEPGVYYLGIKDSTGEIVMVDQTEFYETTFSVSNGTSSVTSVITQEGNNFKLPTFIPNQGYAFVGWYTSENGGGVNVSGNYTPTSSDTLYSYVTSTSLTIKYYTDGGVITETTGSNSWTQGADGLIYLNGSEKTDVYYRTDSTIVNLADYNDSNLMNITKWAYNVVTGSEWICFEGCITSDTVYNQTTDYQISDFCDLSAGSCTIKLKVNWSFAGTVVNANRYKWAIYNSASRLGIYYVTMCYDGSCKFTSKYGLTGAFTGVDWYGDTSGSGFVDESSLATTYVSTDSVAVTPYRVWMFYANYNNCYAGASTSSAVVKTYGWCTYVEDLYLTGFRSDSSNDVGSRWLWDPANNCYLLRGHMYNNSSCS